MREFIRIVALAVGAAVCYGIVHDQITARLCVEYFTIGHPPIFDTTSPTLLGLGWGVLATWWVGVLLGIPLAVMSRIGAMPQLTAREVLKPLLVLMAISGVCALSMGCLGYALSKAHVVFLLQPLASEVPRSRHDVFIADLWAHNASYLSGFLGGVVLMVLVWRWRRQRLFSLKTGSNMVK
jgi:hypothetical protein